MSDRICERETCDNPLGPRQERWCSGNCRKRAADDRARSACEDCGGALGASSQWRAYKRCIPCEMERRHEVHEGRLRDFVVLYEQGKTYREIGAIFGWSDSSKPSMYAREARLRGLIGYRHRGYGQVAA